MPANAWPPHPGPASETCVIHATLATQSRLDQGNADLYCGWNTPNGKLRCMHAGCGSVSWMKLIIPKLCEVLGTCTRLQAAHCAASSLHAGIPVRAHCAALSKCGLQLSPAPAPAAAAATAAAASWAGLCWQRSAGPAPACCHRGGAVSLLLPLPVSAERDCP